MAGWYCNKPGTIGDGARFSSFDHAFHVFYFLLTRCQICVCYERKKWQPWLMFNTIAVFCFLRFKKEKGEEKGRKRKEKERKKKNSRSIDYNTTYTVMITTGNLQFTFSRTGHKTKQHYKNSTHCEWHLRHCISTITKANSQGGTEILKIKVFTFSYNSSSMR